MTFAADSDSRTIKVAYYVRFQGIPTRVSTVNPSDYPGWTPTGTFLHGIVAGSINGGAERLDVDTGLVLQDALSFSVIDSPSARTLFRRRGGDEDFLSATVDANDDVTLQSGAAWPSLPATLYLDRETVTLTAHTGSGTHTTTRGAEDSDAVGHLAGAKLSTAPIHWLTRKATLYAVHLDTGTEEAVFTGTLDASPQFSDGVWRISLVGVMNAMMKRRLCTGWQDQESISVSVTAAGNLQVEVPNAYNFSGQDRSCVRVEAGGKVGIFGGRPSAVSPSVVTSPHTVVIDMTSWVAGDLDSAQQVVDEGSCTVREIGTAYGRAGHLALQAILSDIGDGTVSSYYDVLPGRLPTTSTPDNFVRRRMGAAIPIGQVDVDSFQQAPDSHELQVWLDEEQELGDFLANEVLRRMGGLVFCTGEGVLTFQRYEPAVPVGSLAVLDRIDYLESTVATVDDETARLSTASIECNYHPVLRDYLRRVEIRFADEEAFLEGIGDAASWSSKSIWVGPQPYGSAVPLVSDPLDILDLEVSFDRKRARMSEGGRRFAWVLPWQVHATLPIGTRVKMSHEYLPDLEGGLGVSELVVEVVGRRPDWEEGTVVVDFAEVPTGHLLAPSAYVASYAANVITLSTSAPGDDLIDDAAPGADFIVGARVRIYDASASFGSSSTATIASKTSTTITVGTITPALTPAAGDVVVLEDSANTGNTNDLGADVQDFAFGADSDYLVGTGTGYERAGPKWG